MCLVDISNPFRTPIPRDVVNALAMTLNRPVAHQDRGVVQTQHPKRSALAMGEKLIQVVARRHGLPVDDIMKLLYKSVIIT